MTVAHRAGWSSAPTGCRAAGVASSVAVAGPGRSLENNAASDTDTAVSSRIDAANQGAPRSSLPGIGSSFCSVTVTRNVSSTDKRTLGVGRAKGQVRSSRSDRSCNRWSGLPPTIDRERTAACRDFDTSDALFTIAKLKRIAIRGDVDVAEHGGQIQHRVGGIFRDGAVGGRTGDRRPIVAPRSRSTRNTSVIDAPVSSVARTVISVMPFWFGSKCSVSVEELVGIVAVNRLVLNPATTVKVRVAGLGIRASCRS